MSDVFIVKVQCSLTTNDGSERVLIYDADRYITYEGLMDAEIKAAMRDRPKAYWWATVNDEGQLQLEGTPYPESDDAVAEKYFEQFTYKAMNNMRE